MNDIISNVEQMAKGGTESGYAVLENIAGQMTAVYIVSLVIGLFICFFGLKLMQIFVTLIGFIVGAIGGGIVGVQFQLAGVPIIVVMLIGGTIFGILFCKFYKIGVFVWTFFLVAGTLLLIVNPDTVLIGVICIVGSVVAAILSVIFVEPIVILGTSINGGLSAGSAIAGLLGMSENVWIGIAAGGVIAILGIVAQFMTRSREIGKKERDYAKEIREKVSRETEVERARKILDQKNEKE